MIIIIRAEDLEAARRLQSEISEWVRQHNLHSHYRWLVSEDLTGLDSLIQEESCGILVLPAEVDALQGDKLRPDFGPGAVPGSVGALMNAMIFQTIISITELARHLEDPNPGWWWTAAFPWLNLNAAAEITSRAISPGRFTLI